MIFYIVTNSAKYLCFGYSDYKGDPCSTKSFPNTQKQSLREFQVKGQCYLVCFNRQAVPAHDNTMITMDSNRFESFLLRVYELAISSLGLHLNMHKKQTCENVYPPFKLAPDFVQLMVLQV